MTQSCLGGWCAKRDHCAHYHAASPDRTPSERLCPPGQDGAGLLTIHPEPIDMPRDNYMSIESRLAQVAELLKPTGTTRAVIARAIGISAKSAISRIMGAAVERGMAFEIFARVSDAIKTPEMVYFPTAEALAAFRASYEAGRDERRKQRQQIKARESYKRRSAAISAKRIAARAVARAEREAKTVAADPEYLARRAAEKELANQRKRLYREAKAAEKQREKAEAKTQQKRLKAETKAAGKLVKLKGTASPAAAKPRGPAHLDGPLDLSAAKVQRFDAPPDRFAAKTAPSVISSRECRPWAEAVAA